MGYKHLSLAERYYIQVERKLGKSCSEIACHLGRSPSTVSREVRRNTDQRGYRHQQTDRLARQRHENKPKSLKFTSEIKGSSTFGVDLIKKDQTHTKRRGDR